LFRQCVLLDEVRHILPHLPERLAQLLGVLVAPIIQKTQLVVGVELLQQLSPVHLLVVQRRYLLLELGRIPRLLHAPHITLFGRDIVARRHILAAIPRRAHCVRVHVGTGPAAVLTEAALVVVGFDGGGGH
jgi:hypothetical protein